MQCNSTKFSTCVVNEYYHRRYFVSYLISGIHTDFRTFLCKKCDVGYCAINHGVYRRRSCYRIVFIVSISLLRKILNACQNYIHRIVAYTFLNVCEKIHQFPSNIKKDAHTHPFNGPFSRTTRVSRYQKDKTNLDFTGASDSEWQWHQLGHMQVCTSLQTDNHASTPPLRVLQAGCPSCRPTNSVIALKAKKMHTMHTKENQFLFFCGVVV